MEYFSALKREEILTHSITYMNLEDFYAMWNKPDTKSYKILYDSIYTRYLLLWLLLSLFSRVRLCDPIDGSPPGSTIPGILQARTLEWVAISFSNACSEKWK